MELRVPWFKDRVLMAVGISADILITTLAYKLCIKICIEGEHKIGLGGAVLTTCWIVLSYVAGRYSKQKPTGISELRSDLWATVLVAVGTLGIFLVHSWLIGVENAAAREVQFMMPVLGIAAIVSWQAVTAIKRSRKGKVEEFLCICTDREWEIFAKEYDQEDKSFKMRRIESGECFKAGGVTANDAVVIGNWSSIGQANAEQLVHLRSMGLNCQTIQDWCEQYLGRCPPELLDEQWLVTSRGFKLNTSTLTWRIKRFADIAIASVLLIASLPLVLVACTAIYLYDKGPVLYRQKRSGLFGREIWITKLRSMTIDAESQGIQWAQRDDPRVTRVGKVIRKLRIDELPQLLSVIKGEMSLIGPRPERKKIDEILEKHICHYEVRRWVKPGLSGWAQVSYRYGSSIEDARQKLSYDLYYIRNGGIALDMVIFFKTIRLLANQEGSEPV